MTADEQARAAIGAALRELMRATAEAALPPEIAALLDRLDGAAPPAPPAPPRRRRFWRR